jgi:hypothetical protein
MRTELVSQFHAWSVRTFAIVGCVCFAAIVAKPAEAADGRCLIVVQRHTYLKGTCNIGIESGGSFKVGVGEQSRSKYFAYVMLDAGPENARGYWNGVDADDHAHEDLGLLKRKGGCWSNARAKVCAWR